MQSMRNGIEKHFVRQLELHSHPQLLSYLFLFAPFLFPFLSCMQIELSERERERKEGREGSVAPHTFRYIIYHAYRLSFIIYHPLSRLSAHLFFWGSDLLTCYQNCFLFDIYPTYLGRTQQPPVRVAGRRDPTMASAYPAAAVHAAPNDADAVRHSCADVAPNRRI